MKRGRRRICVIGLGHFGAEIALALTRYCDVLAIDSDIHRVDSLSDRVQRALCLDARDPEALASVVSEDFDEAIVSIGESLEASILATLHLRRIGVPNILAKANNEDHAQILRSVGATRTIFPERETAQRLAVQILNPNLLDIIPLMGEYRMMDVAPTAEIVGKTLVEVQLRKRFGVFAIAIKREAEPRLLFLPPPDYRLAPTDVLVLIGREKDLVSMREALPGGTDGSAS